MMCRPTSRDSTPRPASHVYKASHASETKQHAFRCLPMTLPLLPMMTAVFHSVSPCTSSRSCAIGNPAERFIHHITCQAHIEAGKHGIYHRMQYEWRQHAHARCTRSRSLAAATHMLFRVECAYALRLLSLALHGLCLIQRRDQERGVCTRMGLTMTMLWRCASACRSRVDAPVSAGSANSHQCRSRVQNLQRKRSHCWHKNPLPIALLQTLRHRHVMSSMNQAAQRAATKMTRCG